MKPKCRKLTVRDGMLLVGAAALGLGGYRFYEGFHILIAFRKDYEWILRATSCLVAMTVGFLIVRLLPPRPSRRRLLTQPGMVAACTVLLYALPTALAMAIMIVKHRRWLSSMDWHDVVGETLEFVNQTLPTFGGVSVFLAWAILVMGGRWHRENGWIDGLGIALGLGWVVLSVPAFYYWCAF
jgi:hypothetical protein